MINIAVFASGAGTNMSNMALYFARSPKARVKLVVTSDPKAGVVQRAAKLGVETIVATREELCSPAGLLAELRRRGIGVVVLAGWLRLVPEHIVSAYRGRIVNIHPALLPEFGGKGMYGSRVHEAVIGAGRTRSGITIHLVDEHYDSGAVLARYECDVLPDDTPDTLAARVHRLEYRYYPPVVERLISKLDNMRLLLISNSTNAGEPYLQYPMPQIGDFLSGVSEVVFVPYAAVTFSYAEYEAKVQRRFDQIGIRVRSVHRSADPVKMVRNAEAVCVGGGNTFALARMMQRQKLMSAIRTKIAQGTPYVGWSAGSNVACPTICTTNDMPIVQPESFRAIGAVRFQINPHYLDANPEGHAGETREQRILEYIEANPRRYAVGLREGCMLRIEGGRMELIGSRPMRVFKRNRPTVEVNPGDDLSFLL